jgi:hypothetical protein
MKMYSGIKFMTFPTVGHANGKAYLVLLRAA